jgi:hypothetical protein
MRPASNLERFAAGVYELGLDWPQPNVRSRHIAKLGGTAKIGRNRGMADMAGPAVGAPRSRMTETDI